jgi:hypothetical protein
MLTILVRSPTLDSVMTWVTWVMRTPFAFAQFERLALDTSSSTSGNPSSCQALSQLSQALNGVQLPSQLRWWKRTKNGVASYTSG